MVPRLEDCGALIVDDDVDIRLLIRLTIEVADTGAFVIGEAADGHEALAQVAAFDPCVIVLDQTMPGMSGLETATQVLASRPEQPIILCSAYLDEKLRQKAKALGIRACLSKSEIARIPATIAAIAGAA